jgi:hypothetical protein
MTSGLATKKFPSVDGHLAWLLMYPAFCDQAVLSPLGQYIKYEMVGCGSGSSHAASACTPFGNDWVSRTASIPVVHPGNARVV